MEINKKSWHYKLNAFRTSKCKVDRLEDSCEYKTETIKSILWVIFVSFMALVCCTISGMILLGEDTQAPLWYVVMVGIWGLIGAVATLVLVLLIYETLLSTLGKLTRKIKGEKPKVKKAQGFLATWYDQAKHKYCTRLEFKE